MFPISFQISFTCVSTTARKKSALISYVYFSKTKGLKRLILDNYSIKSLILYPPLSKTVNRQLCFTSEVKLLVERFSITNKLWRNSKLKTGRLKTFPATVRNPKCVVFITTHSYWDLEFIQCYPLRLLLTKERPIL